MGRKRNRGKHKINSVTPAVKGDDRGSESGNSETSNSERSNSADDS
jgi:hypothetical protein